MSGMRGKLPGVANPSGQLKAALDRLTLTLQLQRRSARASADEIPFIMVNETRQMLVYRQAAFFDLKRGKPSLLSISGLAVPDASSPFMVWLNRFVRWRMTSTDGGVFERFDLAEPAVDVDKTRLPAWYDDWKEWLPRYGLWAPLPNGRGEIAGILTFFRDKPFGDAEQLLASHLAESYGLAWSLKRTGGGKRARPLTPWFIALLIAAAAAMFLPMKPSVLAPSEITAKRPALIRSGLDGVIDRFYVEPNQWVEAGEPLILLDDAQLRTRLAVAKKAEDMAEAEYRQLLQTALSDPKSKRGIPLVQGRIEQLAAERSYIESLLKRVVINSPGKGVVLCDNPDEWLGRPVGLGQRIMLVADPKNVEVEIRLPAYESMTVAVGDEVYFYPNVSPIEPVKAVVTYVGYRAVDTPGVGLAFILRADIAASESPLLGLRGVTKLYGPERRLGEVVFRSPLAAARQWLGL